MATRASSPPATPPAAGRPQLVVGTAGHIDHGKSRLVHALTGVDPDRLPEEKARGMTIELGFAYADIDGADVWFVDVPGHERFIRTMVAGAAGVDLALLVVAADDSVMPQTREHAEVLRLLGAARCIVALTKMDLVDDEWADAVELEARELLESLGIQPLEIVRTSVQTGRGLDALRAALGRAARSAVTPEPGSAAPHAAAAVGPAPYTWFRMPVDRAFTVPGRGTVVTGSVLHGAVTPDQELELWPAGLRVRARDLQTHHQRAAAAAGRMRLAVNLAGVSLDQVARGCELATPGCLEPARCVEVAIERLRAPGKSLRRRMRVRLHIATAEVRTELRFADEPAGLEVSNVFAQLLADAPLVASWGQRFILRDDSGRSTLGGGVVLRPVARPWSARRRPDAAGLTALQGAAPRERLREVLRHQRWPDASYARLATRAGLPDERTARKLARDLATAGRLVALGGEPADGLVERGVLDETAQQLNARLAAQLAANPRWVGVGRVEWPGWMPRACPARLRAHLADWLIEQGAVGLVNDFVLPRGAASRLSESDRELYTAILAEMRRGAFQPPGLADLPFRTERNADRVRELVELATARGELRRLADGIWLHHERWDKLIEVVRRLLAERGAFTVAELRTALQSSRRYVVPIVEAIDAAGVTTRVGDQRVAGPRLHDPNASRRP